MISDQIGDLLTRIRNATKVGHPQCLVPSSKLKEKILQILHQEGYIVGYQTIAIDEKKNQFQINFKYKENVSVIEGIKRISKPGLRIYTKKLDLPIVLQGIGIAIVSTSQGVMTNQEAKRKNLGGEILAYVW